MESKDGSAVANLESWVPFNPPRPVHRGGVQSPKGEKFRGVGTAAGTDGPAGATRGPGEMTTYLVAGVRHWVATQGPPDPIPPGPRWSVGVSDALPRLFHSHRGAPRRCRIRRAHTAGVGLSWVGLTVALGQEPARLGSGPLQAILIVTRLHCRASAVLEVNPVTFQ